MAIRAAPCPDCKSARYRTGLRRRAHNGIQILRTRLTTVKAGARYLPPHRMRTPSSFNGKCFSVTCWRMRRFPTTFYRLCVELKWLKPACVHGRSASGRTYPADTAAMSTLRAAGLAALRDETTVVPEGFYDCIITKAAATALSWCVRIAADRTQFLKMI